MRRWRRPALGWRGLTVGRRQFIHKHSRVETCIGLAMHEGVLNLLNAEQVERRIAILWYRNEAIPLYIIKSKTVVYAFTRYEHLPPTHIDEKG